MPLVAIVIYTSTSQDQYCTDLTSPCCTEYYCFSAKEANRQDIQARIEGLGTPAAILYYRCTGNVDGFLFCGAWMEKYGAKLQRDSEGYFLLPVKDYLKTVIANYRELAKEYGHMEFVGFEFCGQGKLEALETMVEALE